MSRYIIILYAMLVICIMVFNQCKSKEVLVPSKKAKSISKVLSILKFSEKTFKKLLSNPERGGKEFLVKKFDKDLLLTEHKIEGFSALTISTKNPSNVHILFFHGGAYVAEGSKAHRLLIEKLCLENNYIVTYFDYPLAPENNAIKTHRIVGEVYQIITELNPRNNFILLGDSAGGGLALAFLQSLVASDNVIIPQKTILLSPWLDISMENPEIKEEIQKEVILDYNGLIECGKLYADTLDSKDPIVSPLYGSLDNLGLIKIFVSDSELFYSDCLKFHFEIYTAQGSECYISIYRGVMHDWILFPIEESDECYEEIVKFIED